MGHSITEDKSILHIKQKKNHWLITSSELQEHITENWFNQEYWLNQGRLLGANSGRGTAWVIKSEWGKWVLRHYLRGGLYAKLNRDHYLWLGLNKTRATKEYELLLHLQKLNLPSPKPIAALVIKKGLSYKNDLIMEHINHDLTFAEHLKQDKQNTNIWQNIGKTIAQYHQHGIYHADLNAHNILIAKDKVHVIDFDKGEIRTPQPSWQQKNMLRLRRSIEKITQKSCDKELNTYWQILIDSYE